MVVFSEQGRLGVNFGDKGKTWPNVDSITPNSLAASNPLLSIGLILHAVEGIGVRRVVDETSFEEGISWIVQAGRPITLTFKRSLLLGTDESEMGRNSELRQAQKRKQAQERVSASGNTETRKKSNVIARRRAAFPQGIAHLLVVGETGSLLAAREYRDNLGGLTSGDLVTLFTEEASNVDGMAPPVLMTSRGVCFIHIRTHPGVRFVFATLHNCFPTVCLELLTQLASLVEQYCGVLSEERILGNLCLIHELFDEAIDYGLPQITKGPQLANHVFERTKERSSYSSTAAELATAATPFSKLSVAEGQNELFVDVVEQLSAMFVTDGGSGAELSAAKLLHAELDGTVWMKSYLQGRPEVRCVFDKMLLIGEQPDEEESSISAEGVVVDDTVFHDCVQVGSSGGAPGAELSSLRVLRIRPPPAEEIPAMRYRVSMDGNNDASGGTIRLPFVVSTRVLPGDAGGVRNVEVHLDAVFPDEHDAEDVCVRVLLPRGAVTCVCSANNARGGIEGERACVGDAGGGGGDKAVFWRMESIQGGAHCVLRIAVRTGAATRGGNDDDEEVSAVGPISLLFDLPMLQCSRVALKHVRVYDGAKANESAHRWLRYVSSSSNFSVRQPVTRGDATFTTTAESW